MIGWTHNSWIASTTPLLLCKKLYFSECRGCAKCRAVCVCIEKQVTCERNRQRAGVIYFISFDIARCVYVCTYAHTAFLKQRHRPLWFMLRLPRSFLIPGSYVNNLSCNRPGESKTNGTAFGKLLARENLLRLLLLFQEQRSARDPGYVFYLSMSNTRLPRGGIHYDS